MSETDLLMSAFKQGYNEAKEQARERITELERREKHLEEMLNGWRDEAKKADARIAELEAALKDATVHLIAAVSLLESGGKKGAPSNKMFEQMLVDYKNGIERARAALKGEK
jgi:predicted nuclease with TOPRIM domain